MEQHRREVQLVITEMIMPQMSGSGLARRLRLSQPAVKLLFISGHAGDSDQRPHRLLDIALVQKPFGPAVPAVKVREVLDRPPTLAA